MSLDNRTCFVVNLRDRLCCKRCGRVPQSEAYYHRGFEYHHLRAQSEGGGDNIENLILLCHDCHTRHHQGRVALPLFDDLKPSPTFKCHCCAEENNIESVEMNCGWYRCVSCRRQTHLWIHFGFDRNEDALSTRIEKKENNE